MAGYVKKTTASKMDGMTITFEITADAAAGTVPDQTLESARGMYLYEAWSKPGSGDDQPDAYNFQIFPDSTEAALGDTNGEVLFQPSANRSQTKRERVGGSNTLGYFPLMTGDEVMTVDALGNSNTTKIVLVFVPTWQIQ